MERMERNPRIETQNGRGEGVHQPPLEVLHAWMAAHVAEVAREWDHGPGRASWEVYRAQYTRDGALAAPTALRSAWLTAVRGPAIRHWTLAAALEQEVISPEDAIVYLRQRGETHLIPAEMQEPPSPVAPRCACPCCTARKEALSGALHQAAQEETASAGVTQAGWPAWRARISAVAQACRDWIILKGEEVPQRN